LFGNSAIGHSKLLVFQEEIISPEVFIDICQYPGFRRCHYSLPPFKGTIYSGSKGFLSEQERDKIGKVAPPDHPGVCPWSLHISIFDSLGLQPAMELPAEVEQTVLGAASDPKQA
jgi:hypothetical protein